MDEHNMCKFGICVDNMGRNDLTLLILQNLNKIMATDPFLSPTLFSLEVAPALSVIPCPIMSFNQIWCFTWDVIVTSFDTAKAILDVPGPKKLYYYIHELPEVKKRDYFQVREVLSNKRFTLLCRAPLQKEILWDSYRVKAEVVNELELFDGILGKVMV